MLASFVWASQLHAKSDPAEARSAKADRARRDSNQTHFPRYQSAVDVSVPAYSKGSFTRNGRICKAAGFACLRFMSNQGYIVYVLRSDSQPDRYYTGLTDNVERRLGCTTVAVHSTPLTYGHGRSLHSPPSQMSTVPRHLRPTSRQGPAAPFRSDTLCDDTSQRCA